MNNLEYGVTVLKNVACGICNGPMRMCQECVKLDLFPAHCADEQCRGYMCMGFAGKLFETISAAELPPAHCTKYDMTAREKRKLRYQSMARRKKAEGRCLQCGFDVPLEEARAVSGGVCAKHRKAMTDYNREWREKNAAQQ